MDRKHLSKKQQKYVGIAAIAIAVIAIALIIWLAGVPLVRFASEPENSVNGWTITAYGAALPTWAWSFFRS